ncbi:type II inositol 1 [Tropilaelaps mercedesae]|uniref:Type II inositol 1 n=1 Tax=Tropilaelaps mercedesae TaxID=418985 RepID=A0A1V9XMX9_9ACAR|nr:type II inositol 1 [Tropilaelaps mercedesae]
MKQANSQTTGIPHDVRQGISQDVAHVIVDQLYLHFSDVHFYERVTRSFTVTNVSNNIVKFYFKPHPKSGRYARRWLKVEPLCGVLKKGEMCEINVEVLVDSLCAPSFNGGIDEGRDVLILHPRKGKDIYISIDIDYRYSCFGSSLEALVRHKTPIGRMNKQKLLALEQDPQKHAELMVPFEIPTELWILIDCMLRKGIDVEGLFVKDGCLMDIESIRDALDFKTPDTQIEASPFSVAQCLLLFLKALREPVIPSAFFFKAIESATSYAQAKKILQDIPKVHQDTFIYLVAFLHEVAKLSRYNGLNIDLLAAIFSSVMLRPSQDTQMTSAIEEGRCAFLSLFISDPFDV